MKIIFSIVLFFVAALPSFSQTLLINNEAQKVRGSAALTPINGISSDRYGNPLSLQTGNGRTTEPSGVSNGTPARATFDILGVQVVRPYSLPELTNRSCSSAATGTADTAIVAAAASVRTYITSISCANTSAVASAITFKDGATAAYIGAVGTQAATGGGFNTTFPVPLRLTVNTAFNFAMVTTSTSTTCCAVYYQSSN